MKTTTTTVTITYAVMKKEDLSFMKESVDLPIRKYIEGTTYETALKKAIEIEEQNGYVVINSMLKEEYELEQQRIAKSQEEYNKKEEKRKAKLTNLTEEQKEYKRLRNNKNANLRGIKKAEEKIKELLAEIEIRKQKVKEYELKLKEYEK